MIIKCILLCVFHMKKLTELHIKMYTDTVKTYT